MQPFLGVGGGFNKKEEILLHVVFFFHYSVSFEGIKISPIFFIKISYKRKVQWVLYYSV